MDHLKEPKKIKAIIAEHEFISRAFNNQVTIETIEKIDKWVNGDWEKGISGLMCLYEDFQKLGINDARIETLLAEPKNLSFLMKNISYIKEFSNVNLEQMNKWSGDNIQNMESLLNNVDIDKFKSLSKIGVKADTLDKWSEGKFENVKYLLDNIEGLKELSNLGITIEEIKQCEDLATIEALINSKDVLSFIEPTTISEIKKLAVNKFTSLINDVYVIDNLLNGGIDFDKIAELSNKDIEKTKFLLGSVSEINKLSEHEQIWQEIQPIILSSTDSNEPSWKCSELIVKNPDEVIALANSGLGVKAFKEIYEIDSSLAKAIIDDSKKIIPILAKKELTSEDLKKCKVEDIQKLANGTITAQQLKTSLTKKAPAGKWTAKVQEERQTIAKEDKGSQR